jgi:DNA-binding GntR family transcriptional regulator
MFHMIQKMNKGFNQIWESIAQDLKESIVKGELKPGQRLKIEEISTQYGASNTPVREAFRYLASQGFVVNIPRKKVIVKEYTLKEIEDTYAIHTVIEGLAAKLAAQYYKEKELKKLEDVYSRMEKCFQEGNLVRYIQVDKEFHGSFIRRSENLLLIPMAENLSSRIERFRFTTLRFPERAKESLNEHKRILSAFKNRDPETAEKEVKNHMLLSLEYVKHIYGKSDDLILS